MAQCRRRWRERTINGSIPWTLAISPTMKCNYDCGGCYSRGRPTDDELTTDELDKLFGEAEELGILSVVVTGGEPLLRDDLVDILASHRSLLFVLITNGSLVTADVAERIAASGNIIPLVSIEGFPSDTDGRRRPGAHSAGLEALRRFRDEGLCFGFAAMNTSANTDHLATDAFIDGMADRGCALGFLTEYVPCGSAPKSEWFLSEDSREAFRRRVLDLRTRKRLVLIQFPHDEYGVENRCTAAGQASLHISSRGDVEPCPFVPIACENIREGGLLTACESPFMRRIRERPELLTRGRLACSLFEHREELEELAREHGARSDRGPRAD